MMSAGPEFALELPPRANSHFQTRIVPWLAPLCVLLVAVTVRVPFYDKTTFPLNDGGMFAQMLDDLRANHFFLPLDTSYNFEHIPFCYPPLGFYFGAFAQAVTGASTLSILRWLPLVFNLASVLAVYVTAVQLFRSRVVGLCAGILYAVLPRSAEWLTMGGGLTRSPGELFVVLSVFLFTQGRTARKLHWAAVAGISAGLAMLTHLEAGVLAGTSLIVFALFTRPLRVQIPDLLLAGTVAVLVVAPWLLWMLHLHGASPFIAALNTKGDVNLGSSHMRLVLGVVLVLAAIPLWWLRFAPLVPWLIATELAVPRSAATHSTIMLSLIGALLITTLAEKTFARAAPVVSLATASVLAVAITAYYIHTHRFPQDRLRDLTLNTRAALTEDSIEAMRWVNANVPPGTRFFVFNQRIDPWFADLVGEWFPYLAQRESIYTAQGKEWLPAHAFAAVQRHIPECERVHSDSELDSQIQPASFKALFLAGPYDGDHARCAAYLRAEPGMHLVFKRGENEVYLRY